MKDYLALFMKENGLFIDELLYIKATFISEEGKLTVINLDLLN